MGNRKSKPSAEVNGDKDVTIINNQEVHSDYHEEHSVKLNIILVIVILQLMFVMYKVWHKRVQRKAFRKAQSIADIDKV